MTDQQIAAALWDAGIGNSITVLLVLMGIALIVVAASYVKDARVIEKWQAVREAESKLDRKIMRQLDRMTIKGKSIWERPEKEKI